MATSARDTDSSVEQDPGAGRSVDRAPRHGGRGHDAIDVEPWRINVGAEGHQRKGTSEGSDARAESQVERLSERSEGRGGGRGRRRREPATDRSHPAVDSPRGEPPAEHHSRAIGESTRSERAPRTQGGQPPGGRTGGAPEPRPITLAVDGTRRRNPGGRLGNEAAGGSGSSRSDSLRRETERSEARSDREVDRATNGRRGAGRSDAARLPTRSKPSQGGAPAGNPDPARRASARTTDPEETWRTQTRYRLQHAGSRERRKPPRWWKTTRAEHDPTEWHPSAEGDSPESPGVDVHGDIGRWAHSKGRSSRRGRIELRREARADPARLGGNAEGEAEVGGDATRDSRGSVRVPRHRKTVELPPETVNSRTGSPKGQRRTDALGEAGDRATSNTS